MRRTPGIKLRAACVLAVAVVGIALPVRTQWFGGTTAAATRAAQVVPVARIVPLRPAATRAAHVVPASGVVPLRPAATKVVTINNFAFSPMTVTVRAGATVMWVNMQTGVPHTSTSNATPPVWDSGTLQPGQSFSFTFTTRGVFKYHCSIHHFMHGTVIVR